MRGCSRRLRSFNPPRRTEVQRGIESYSAFSDVFIPEGISGECGVAASCGFRHVRLIALSITQQHPTSYFGSDPRAYSFLIHEKQRDRVSPLAVPEGINDDKQYLFANSFVFQNCTVLLILQGSSKRRRSARYDLFALFHSRITDD